MTQIELFMSFFLIIRVVIIPIIIGITSLGDYFNSTKLFMDKIFQFSKRKILVEVFLTFKTHVFIPKWMNNFFFFC